MSRPSYITSHVLRGSSGLWPLSKIAEISLVLSVLSVKEFSSDFHETCVCGYNVSTKVDNTTNRAMYVMVMALEISRIAQISLVCSLSRTVFFIK